MSTNHILIIQYIVTKKGGCETKTITLSTYWIYIESKFLRFCNRQQPLISPSHSSYRNSPAYTHDSFRHTQLALIEHQQLGSQNLELNPSFTKRSVTTCSWSLADLSPIGHLTRHSLLSQKLTECSKCNLTSLFLTGDL